MWCRRLFILGRMFITWKDKNLDEVFLLWRVAGQNETFDMINNHSEERFNALYFIKDYAFRKMVFVLKKMK